MTMISGKKYRIVSHFRFFLFICIIVMTLIMAGYSIFANDTQAATSTCTYKLVTVRENDTLWTLADEYGPDNIDNRTIVREICDTNDIDAEDDIQGLKIFVPVEIN